MKKHYFHHPFYFLLLFFAFNLTLVAQDDHPYLDNEGGGHHSINQKECIIKSTYQLMQNSINKNVDSLQKINQLPSASSRSIVRFSWPLRQATGFNDPSYYFISNYVDVDQTSGRMRDYRCNQQTYDNHKGIDITTWPFSAYKQTANAVEVIAAASGVIIDKNDGAFDENCTQRNGAVANYITIRHSDGSIALYYHLKKNSVTSKSVGTYVSEGSYLGVVGSSGFSSGPHLHFEVWSDQWFSNLIDPYSGSCNTLNGSSWWKSQKPYKEMKINRIMTHHSEPNQPNCPYNGEVRAAADEFDPGDRIYFSIHLAHENGGTKYFTIYRPNGTVWDSWSQTKGAYNDGSWWFWRRTLPSTASSGNWRYEVSYKGQRITHTFKIKGQSNPCSNISTIQCGQTINSNTINATNDFETSDYTGCYAGSSSFNGNDKVYKVTLSNTGNLNIKLSGLSRDLDLFLLSGCGGNKRCLAKSTKSGTTIDEINYSNARGTYYIVIDGYNSAQNSNFQLSVNCGCTCSTIYDPVCGADGKTYSNSCKAECAGVSWTRGECSAACQCTSQYDHNICDDFDSYTPNRKIGPQSSCWTTWTGQEGGNQDAYVLRSSSSGNQYIKIEGTNSNGGGPHDVVLKLGDKRSGIYELKFDLWTFRGDKGYYNIQHRFSTGSNNNQWASNVYFDGNGGGYLLVQNRRYSFSYSTSRWVEIRQYIDLSRDQTTLYVDGRKVHDWKFSAQATTTSIGTRQLSAIDFYPIDNSYEFYIDDVKLTKVSNFVTEDLLGDSRTNTTKPAPTKTVLTTTTSRKVSMTLFPNPTNNVVNITFAGFDNQAVSMILFNMMGQKIYQQSIYNSDGSSVSIEVDHLPKGTYILRANGTSGQQQQQKLIIF